MQELWNNPPYLHSPRPGVISVAKYIYAKSSWEILFFPYWTFDYWTINNWIGEHNSSYQ